MTRSGMSEDSGLPEALAARAGGARWRWKPQSKRGKHASYA